MRSLRIDLVAPAAPLGGTAEFLVPVVVPANNDAEPAANSAVAVPLPRGYRLKRGVDLAFAMLGLVAYLPAITLAALAIALIDPGPVFYAQKRRGRNGRILKVWKLRTMYRDAEARLERHLRANPAARAEWARFFKLRRDPRILPVVGRFLRQSSIDELPQLWNVIRGEMTLVGPRPLPDYHLATFDAAFRELRQTVVPGMTGLWQVACRSDGDAVVLRALDAFYVRNHSLGLDLHILVRTLGVVLAGKGAR